MVCKGLSILCICENETSETLLYALYHDVKYVSVI